MTALDVWVAALYGAFLVALGLLQRRRGRGSVEDYFVSGRKLRWWAAGTSMIAASFASDTPLLVCALVRSKGIWGNWQWWGLGVSTILTVFLFAPLWRRSGVLTEAELTELRYGGRAAAALRGFKAVYWGLLYNCFAAGAWGLTGLATIAQTTAGVDRGQAILLCAGLGGAYALASGLWGVVAADMAQFVFAIAGALLTALFAVRAAGGLPAVVHAASPEQTAFLPSHPQGISLLLACLLVQWWAWKNTDGGGVLVQRMAACRDEREAVKGTLFFNVVHYSVRCWPWVAVALASLVLVPDSALPRHADGAPNHQAAYAIVMREVLPAGLRGFVVAWFFAEFMASIAGAMNWGASLLVNDGYRRFVRPDASPRRTMVASRLAAILVLLGSVAAAFASGDIVKAFEFVLGATAGTGVVLGARWLWWRVNVYAEIAAMVASPVAALVANAAQARGMLQDPLRKLLATIAMSIAPAAIALLVTRPEATERLKAFYLRTRPPGPGWRRIAALCAGGGAAAPPEPVIRPWLTAVLGIGAVGWGVGSALLLRPAGYAGIAAGAALLVAVVRRLR